ncbi:MAG TPA: hypothetical protein VN778_01970, partial [Verrucomicrobiae bacterium]|nr:hypothetical protein [Verrucomicrobiae bacterium]
KWWLTALQCPLRSFAVQDRVGCLRESLTEKGSRHRTEVYSTCLQLPGQRGCGLVSQLATARRNLYLRARAWADVCRLTTSPVIRDAQEDYE